MKTENLSKEFWDARYNTGETAWNIGSISTPLKAYFDQLKDKNITILIPGCGNSYEAEYLYNLGFKNVFILDYSSTPLDNFKKRLPDFPASQLINEDFFKHIGKYDLIVEQTFFCAIDPSLRPAYSEKMHRLLNKGGKLAGLLFDAALTGEKPPFGGNIEEYKGYFLHNFQIHTFEKAYNSIEPRAGRELFMILKKIEKS